jgi:23S rRNA (uracil1939-C5)-methyltransferase
VRVAPGTGQALVGLVTTGGVETRLRALAERCLDAGDGLKTATGLRVRVRSVVRSLQDADTNVLLGRRVVPLLGSDRIEDLYMGLRLKLSLTSFFQPNGAAARAAFRQVVEYAREHSCRRAVDAYAGIGVAAMVLAPSVERVAAIEEVRSAVRDGRVNCQANGAANVEYLEGSVETKLGEALGGEPLDLVVLDPPRRGLTPEALTAVVERRPARVAYLSCSIASLARDLQGLDAAYALERIIPFDFLPQTEHVEVLAFLRRR